jgi:hypothetical protein
MFVQSLPSIAAYGPFQHMLGGFAKIISLCMPSMIFRHRQDTEGHNHADSAAVNALGAFLLGIVTSPRFPREIAGILVPAFRILSAIVTMDAYGLHSSGKQVI